MKNDLCFILPHTLAAHNSHFILKHQIPMIDSPVPA